MNKNQRYNLKLFPMSSESIQVAEVSFLCIVTNNGRRRRYLCFRTLQLEVV